MVASMAELGAESGKEHSYGLALEEHPERKNWSEDDDY